MKRQYITFLSLIMVAILIGLFYIDVCHARTLYWGTRGADVREVQEKLRKWGYYKGTVDGVYGKETYRAVISFQRKNGLRSDGLVGENTKKALGITKTKKTTTTYSKLIETAQRKLKQWGYYKGAVDGIYGSKTYNAVIKFQRKNGLKVDGYIGSQTRKALGISPKTAASKYAATSKGVSKSDEVTLLAMAINGEARGEPYVGQVAVGAVILNRVKNPSFPNSIAGVIYQPLAFEAVTNGQIYTPLKTSTIKAARDAMNGWDPTGGALYYWNPAKASGSSWIWKLKPTLRIGRHVFAKK
ncbi:spore cortex-lytic enzyme [Paramaledivibacter caminithermalis]|jgi:spore cortex-lytic enzyme|uniref:Spore cortex-lytic enzyme n=1 Tax=Paramaledivibacter caminithermalis (strain DSM 15212 / CIP 107654 / DViRD3) TaxID=1121301 RepID=A0A1M6LF02_PARC5|nr:spore cortex-lytic enzyme [Paramaledivibacter caminithermalis]SHJ69742.1 spore cortex-lytic enzyme [Paramaledivibacter caminithermalis DSM 15212]